MGVQGMRHIGYEMTDVELERIVAALDSSGGRRIGYKEFISALIERKVKFDRQQLWECFKKFDHSGSGYISYEDVRAVLHGGGDGSTPGITESEWLEMPGAKASQGLCFDEFVALMESSGD